MVALREEYVWDSVRWSCQRLLDVCGEVISKIVVGRGSVTHCNWMYWMPCRKHRRLLWSSWQSAWGRRRSMVRMVRRVKVFMMTPWHWFGIFVRGRAVFIFSWHAWTHLWNDDQMDGHGWLPRNWDLDLAEALIRKTGTWRRAAQPMAMIQWFALWFVLLQQ